MPTCIDCDSDGRIGCAPQFGGFRKMNGHARRKNQCRTEHQKNGHQESDAQERSDFQLATKRFDGAGKSHAALALAESQTILTISPAAFSMSRTMALTRLTR